LAEKMTPKQVLDGIKEWTVLELSEFTKMFEEEFGVTAAAPVAVAGISAPAGGEEGGAAEEEKTQYDIILVSAGDKKIPVIKEVRAITNLGLKEAKALVEEAPKPVKEGINKEEADKLKSQLEEAGAVVELK
jgi:large subunit ribosomal protein L7/L12